MDLDSGRRRVVTDGTMPNAPVFHQGALPDFELRSRGSAAGAFRALGVESFHAAARHVWALPYGRNSDRADYRLVLPEGRGTCATKHALLAALAAEHGAPVRLLLCLYLMDGTNTPGVGPVLEAEGLDAVPEAHCVLVSAGRCLDLTHPGRLGTALPEPLLRQEFIEPGAIGAYKVGLHRHCVAEWARERGVPPARVWEVRERCIAALAAGEGG